MDFEKKYWSSDEFTTKDGNSYKGFVGIYEGNAYSYDNEELLTPNDTYTCRINCSENNYDRTLSHELKLPYDKKDILFGANDFLYSSTLRNAVERLEANNNYIFQNSIISNSIIPNADYCVMLAAQADNIGKLSKFNFADKAFDNTTATDPTFYEKTIYEDTFSSKNLLGEKGDMLSDKTIFVASPAERLNHRKYLGPDENTTLAGKTAKEIWELLYGLSSFETGNIISNTPTTQEINRINSWKNSLKSNYTPRPDSIETREYFYNDIKGSITRLPIGSSGRTFTIKLKDERISNLYDTLSSNTDNFKIKLKELYFIIVKNGDEIPNLSVLYNGASIGDVRCYMMSNKNHYLVKCTVSDNLITLVKEQRAFDIKILGCDMVVTTYHPLHRTNDLMCDYLYDIGTGSSIANEYRYLPKLERHVSYHYIWARDTDKNTEVKHGSTLYGYANADAIISPSAYTYKHLAESVNWFNSENPGFLRFYPQNPGDLLDFVPDDDMTAEDAYIFMTNNITSYKSFPNIYKKTYYTFPGEENSEFTYVEETLPLMEYSNSTEFRTSRYNIASYAIAKFDNNREAIKDSYKYALDVYNELDMDNQESILEWDYIPVVEKTKLVVKDTAVTSSSNSVFHNFDDITASNIVVKDVKKFVTNYPDGTEKEETVLDLLLFLTFKNKLIIFPMEYNVDNFEYNTDKSLVVDLSTAAVNNLNNPSKRHTYLEIKNIDPVDKTSLKFLSLNAIKVHKKMMYLVDNKLNMVLRYDIEGLFETASEGDFKQIKLLNMLQGSGDSTDKIYFNEPYSIDADDNRVYIADRGNKCVKVYTPGLSYLKTLKNGFFSAHDIQAVAINPCGCIVNGKKIKPNSLWIATSNHNRIYISILSEDIVIDYGQIEDISLQQDRFTWEEEVRVLVFSKSNSNYFYLNTNKRIYKLHTSKPYYPFATMTYFNQRSLINIMKWRTMNYPWHKLPSIYSAISDNVDNKITWSYRPPAVAAELLDNKCFSLTNVENFNVNVEGDIIFHFGVLYDNSKIVEFIKENTGKVEKEMSFKDIPSVELAKMIKSAAMLIYREPDGYISSLSNNELKIYDSYEYSEKGEDDYINALTFNKMLYAMVFNLLRLKNNLMGTFKAATNADNVIVYDNLIIDDYFNNLQINNDADYFIHDNELTTVIVNRTLENIYNLQKKILARMQTTFMATQSWVNNVSRII